MKPDPSTRSGDSGRAGAGVGDAAGSGEVAHDEGFRDAGRGFLLGEGWPAAGGRFLGLAHGCVAVGRGYRANLAGRHCCAIGSWSRTIGL